MNIRKLVRTPARDIALVVEAALLFAAARVLIRLVSFRRILWLLGEPGGPSPAVVAEVENQEARRISWAIARGRGVWGRSPGTCWPQAIAAQIMLRRRRTPGVVHLGLSRPGGDRLQAHAWVRRGDVILTGEAGHQYFHVVSAFAPRAAGSD